MPFSPLINAVDCDGAVICNHRDFFFVMAWWLADRFVTAVPQWASWLLGGHRSCMFDSLLMGVNFVCNKSLIGDIHMKILIWWIVLYKSYQSSSFYISFLWDYSCFRSFKVCFFCCITWIINSVLATVILTLILVWQISGWVACREAEIGPICASSSFLYQALEQRFVSYASTHY